MTSTNPHPNESAAEGPKPGSRAGQSGKGPIALTADLLFASRITGAGNVLGIRVRVVRQPADVEAAAHEHTGVLLDLSADPAGLLELVGRLRRTHPDLPVIGFAPHVDAGLIQAARDAGAKVYTRAGFAARLPEILRSLA